jgi:hypothetical protein
VLFLEILVFKMRNAQKNVGTSNSRKTSSKSTILGLNEEGVKILVG